MLSPTLEVGDVVIKPCYLLVLGDDDRTVSRWKARFYRRARFGQLVGMADPERDEFMRANPGVESMLAEMRAVSAELRADAAEHRLRQAQSRVLELEREQTAVHALLDEAGVPRSPKAAA